jgi:SAM-dependent methyltransferase
MTIAGTSETCCRDDPVPVWTNHAADSGRRSVINPSISEWEFDQVTREQVAYFIPLMTERLTGDKDLLIDYGCGPGRFCGPLSGVVQYVIGYDPCLAFIEMAPLHERVFHTAVLPLVAADIVFVWAVLGGIGDEKLDDEIDKIVGLMASGGLLLFADHTPDEPPRGTAWKFRHPRDYTEPFAARGVALERIGQTKQYLHEIMIYAGRKA